MVNISIEPGNGKFVVRMKWPGKLESFQVRGDTMYEAAARWVLAGKDDLGQIVKLREILREQDIPWIYPAHLGPGKIVLSNFGPDLAVGPSPDIRRQVETSRGKVERELYTTPIGYVVSEAAVHPTGKKLFAAALFPLGEGYKKLASYKSLLGLSAEDLLWWAA